ncbi:hypothetical protein BX600DRAFT_146496 [Xylariales sp. PMI_506]|nr:hypothetical protein BX600DRAFT_146496 [Xylariales sp. PMI_506]
MNSRSFILQTQKVSFTCFLYLSMFLYSRSRTDANTMKPTNHKIRCVESNNSLCRRLSNHTSEFTFICLIGSLKQSKRLRPKGKSSELGLSGLHRNTTDETAI